MSLGHFVMQYHSPLGLKLVPSSVASTLADLTSGCKAVPYPAIVTGGC